MHVRKQEDKLTVEDLNKNPVWEYVLDEECVQFQNEKTLKPYIVPLPLDRNQVYFLVRATFRLISGAIYVGYIKPLKQAEDKLMHSLIPYDLNPVIVTNQGHVSFCYGINKPNKLTLSENYRRLNNKSINVFPIEFKADIDIKNSISEGILEGFLYIEQSGQSIFRLKASDVKYVK